MRLYEGGFADSCFAKGFRFKLTFILCKLLVAGELFQFKTILPAKVKMKWLILLGQQTKFESGDPH